MAGRSCWSRRREEWRRLPYLAPATFRDLTHAPVSDALLATFSLAGLTIINCLGVRAGGSTQNVLMGLKIVAIAGLVGCGYFLIGRAPVPLRPVLDRPPSFGLLTAFGAAVVP